MIRAILSLALVCFGFVFAFYAVIDYEGNGLEYLIAANTFFIMSRP